MPIKIEVCANCGCNAFIRRRQVKQCDNCGYCERKEITVYTRADLDKAVADEREACAQECLMLDGARLDDSFTDALEMCAEAIRNRGQNDNSN